uniref:LysM domain-containing protein n=1 Tax=Candidatus Kentrum sp. TC TaxID=2126339 RepID=A0A451A7K6_9GAMM|nr:MAG: LysM domain-containing protein [Candidatus Kentron sp. TC]VFK62012.1 MAG: LysM domain-containing protein [Candidatus Kentron sp. TC]
MENTEPKSHDDWRLEKDHYELDLQPGSGNNRSSADKMGFVYPVTVVASVIMIIAAITFLVLNTIIGPVQRESREIKEMISALQDFRRSDIGVLRVRLDGQERILKELLEKVSESKKTESILMESVSPKSVVDRAPSGHPDMKATDAAQYTLYAVRKNDTLGAIAKRHRVSVKRIMEENEIKSRHKISIGQEIYIPAR